MWNHLMNVLNSAGSIGVIGGADGPTAVFVTMPDGVQEALGIMGKGMLGIFVVIGLIALIVAMLTKAGISADKQKSAKEAG